MTRRLLHRLAVAGLCVVSGGAAVLSLAVLFGGAGRIFGHDLAFYGIVDMRPHLFAGVPAALLWLAAIVGFSWALCAFRRLSCSAWANFALVLVLAFGARAVFFLCSCDGIVQVSDNQIAWTMAIGDVPENDYLLWIPRWMNHTLILRWISRLFGTGQGVAAMIGVVFSSLTAAAVVLVGREAAGDMFRARIAAFAYAFFPACVAYSVVCTPEHFAAACFSGSVFCLIRLFKSEKTKKAVGWVLAAGILLGLGDSVKPLATIFIAAFAIALLPGVCGRARREKITAFALLALVGGIQFCVSAGMLRLSECEFGIRLADKKSSAHMLVVGLNRQGEGQLHLGGISRTVPQMMKNGATLEEASRAGLKALADDWQGRFAEIPSFLAKKAIWAWQDFNIPFRALSVLHGDMSGFGGRGAPKWMPAVSQTLYMLLMFSALAAVIRPSRNGSDGAFLLLCMIVGGYFCASMVIESQSRYKYLVLPYVFVIASSMRCRLADGTAPSAAAADLRPGFDEDRSPKRESQ